MFDQELVDKFGGKYAGLVLLEQLKKKFSFSTVTPFWSPGFRLWEEYIRGNDAVNAFLGARRENYRLDRDVVARHLKGVISTSQARKERADLDACLRSLGDSPIRLPDGIEKMCVDAVKDWDCTDLILRSSMSVEDNPNSSDNPYAGQFFSIIVCKEYLIPNDFSSFYHANASHVTQKVLPADIRFNFIAQPYLTFDAGGVVFSRLPGTDITSIEASVDGPAAVTRGSAADMYDLCSGKLIRVDARNDYNPGDELPACIVRGKKVCIAEEQAVQVADLAVGIEKELGVPVDMEFGFLQGVPYLLQIRKISQRSEDAGSIPSGEPILESNICLSPGRFNGVVLGLPKGEELLIKTLRYFERVHPDTKYMIAENVQSFEESFAEFSIAFPNMRGLVVTTEKGSRVSHAAINMRVARTMYLGFRERPPALGELLTESFEIDGKKIGFSKSVIARCDGYRGAVYEAE
ncbi:hypothetical protein HZB90_03825 [archaeon]|nr:hypothetical protein [archaeon]